ncbi:hypothetical protein FOZ62_003904, partial [Perkinsus olseni]
RTLRMLYPGMPVKTCLLKEVPTVLELERQLSYLLHSLTALLNDNGEVEDYTVAQACEFAEIDKYSELCATRRAMLRGAAAAGGGQSSTSTSQRTKPQKQRERELAKFREAEARNESLGRMLKDQLILGGHSKSDKRVELKRWKREQEEMARERTADAEYLAEAAHKETKSTVGFAA